MSVLNLDERVALLPGVPARRIVHEMPWLTAELAATEIARDRLRIWAAAGGADREAPDVREGLAFHGDEGMLPTVVAAVRLVPPPVRDYVLADVLILGIGWNALGWTGGEVPRRPTTINLSACGRDQRELLRVTLHEIAHAFVETNRYPLVSAAAKVALNDLAQAEGWSGEQLQRCIDETERRADALAAQWAAMAAGRREP